MFLFRNRKTVFKFFLYSNIEIPSNIKSQSPLRYLPELYEIGGNLVLLLYKID